LDDGGKQVGVKTKPPGVMIQKPFMILLACLIAIALK
jgi:hypothetical protein